MTGTTLALLLALVFVLAASVTVGLILVLRPFLIRHALAKPIERSSHHVPTPQGGGIAVLAGNLVAVGVALSVPMFDVAAGHWWLVAAAAIVLAIVGGIDDVRSLPIAPRLALQCATVGLVVYAFPADMRIISILPEWIERVLLLLAGVYLVNVVNFMDGIDWMTVAEFVPISVGLVLLSFLGALPPFEAAAAIALGGAIIGFAPFNRPVAALFLGDVGSLPLGLLLFWLLTELAVRGQILAALLLPLYYLMDASLTLLRRLVHGEPLFQAHRTHFYQRATDLGFSVPSIVAHVFIVNVVLVLLAASTVAFPSTGGAITAVGLGVILVGALLMRLSGRRT